MGLAGFAPKSAKFKAKLVGGRSVTLTLRPFTLADLAWFQNEFSEDDTAKFAMMQPDVVCRAVWHMLEPESKMAFGNITFTDVSENTGQPITVEVFGYEKMLHSIADESALIAAYDALAKSRGLNGFANELKKKTTQRRRWTLTIGPLFMTGWRRLTA